VAKQVVQLISWLGAGTSDANDVLHFEHLRFISDKSIPSSALVMTDSGDQLLSARQA